ncbi:hypothetical protein IAR55_002680 [Kwoniella newhampshirensis]|uniref:Inner centromere protein ARK-binding domain-containing protein n=1 Tax=Kwoniella newhampshirensis TaxID=1651941 RepID=A0AAW0YRN0_9TREE
MATAFATQLQPFEENQSPSPEETNENPYEVTLARRRSRRSSRTSHGSGGIATSPNSTVNTLHRQLSGDPESPPPAWKRRSTVSSRSPRSPGGNSPPLASGSRVGTTRSPSQSSATSAGSGPPSARRHPNLMMTTSARQPATALPNGMSVHESPNSSSANLADLALPNPAFRRRQGGTGSNRSSVSSSQDLSGLTGEELWAMNHEQDIRDMSNPTRLAEERPLDTIRRLSKAMEQPVGYHPGLPGDVIWPSAPPQDVIPPIKSKSYTNIAKLGSKPSKRMSKRGRSREASIDTTVSAMSPMGARSTPTSPVVYTVGKPGTLSSAHSSSASLSSQNIPSNKSFPGMNGLPPSSYYSRDFLSSLAPREGGYAIAATMGGGLGAVGTMSVEEKRRSAIHEDSRSRSTGSRAPLARSAGMGRWSLDGGEHYGRPYATPSAATTSSNLSAPPVNSADPSPPLETASLPGSDLPEGASPPHLSRTSASTGLVVTPISSNPAAPSPLSQQTSAEDVAHRSGTVSPPPVPTEGPALALNTKKSKKQLAKDAKAAEKAEAVKVARERAEAARAEAIKKQAARDAEIKAKEDAKRKEREEKARRKLEKKAAKGSRRILGRKKSTSSLPSQTTSSTVPPVPPLPAQFSTTTTNVAPAAAVPQPSSATAAGQINTGASTPPEQKATLLQSIAKPIAPIPPPPAPKPTGVPTRPQIQPKRSLFGTIKKRFSYMGSSDDKEPSRVVPPVPKLPASSRAAPGPVVERTIPPQTPQTVIQAVTNVVVNMPEEKALLPARRDSLLAAPFVAPHSDSAATAPTDQDLSAEKRRQSLTRSASYGIPTSPAPTPAHTLAKTTSNENTSASPSGSVHRKRGSVMGPRPMPRRLSQESHPRPTSISSEHNSSDPTSISHAFGTAGAPAEPLGAPVPLPVTPSTSGDSALSYIHSHASHMSTGTPITSPSVTDAGSTSRKDSMSEESHSLEQPERESSKDSNETVLIGREEPTSMAVAV